MEDFLARGHVFRFALSDVTLRYVTPPPLEMSDVLIGLLIVRYVSGDVSFRLLIYI